MQRKLVKYQSKVITTEAENEKAMPTAGCAYALALELEHRPSRTPEEDALLELLVTLIEKFEDEHYPIPEGLRASLILHLMEAQNIQEKDLLKAIASPEELKEILNGKRAITPTEAEKLAELFKVDASLFF